MIKIIQKYKKIFTIKCTECGCRFELEESDLNRHGDNYFVGCPSCGYILTGIYEYLNPQFVEIVAEDK